jgi:MFS family permease
MSHSNGAPKGVENIRKPSLLLRWTVLIFLGLAMFGNYYVYDSIAPIADMLETELGFSDSAIGTLNAVYSIPNLVMVLLGGIIIDRIGTKRATIAFAVICMAGAIVTSMQNDLLGMAAGRFIFGMGAESLIVAASAAIAKWFRGKELSLAFAMKITLARLGSLVAENSPTWAEQWYDNWQTPLVIAVFFALISVVTAILYAVSEYNAEKKYDLGKAGDVDKVEFKEIFRFNKSFWYITLLCVTFYSAIFPFKTFAIKMFEHMGSTHQYAGFLSSLTTLFAMICMPIFGFFIDKVGRRALIMTIGSAMLIPVYILIGMNAVNFLIPMAILGVAYALVPAVMWPSVAYVVKDHQTGTAYGLMTMVQNIGLIVFNFGIGAVNDVAGAGAENVDGYWPGLLIFSSLGVFGVIWALLLRKNELGPNGHGLERIEPTKA